MPKDELDPNDPYEIVAVELRGQSEKELGEMALCFAEEFARKGWDEEQIFQMFKNPFYQGPHLVWKQTGDAFVRNAVCEALTLWRHPRRRA